MGDASTVNTNKVGSSAEISKASLITQVSRDDDHTTAPAWTAPKQVAHVAAPKKKRSFFQRLCACCFSSSAVADGSAGGATATSPSDRQLVPRQRPASVVGSALLPAQAPEHTGRKCLVLDLDETLVHSSFKQLPYTDFQIEVEVDGTIHPVYVSKRPAVDEFIRRMGEHFEVVIFTASLSKYADPVMDLLDPNHICTYRLFREHCSNHQGVYVKDLSRLGRPLKDVIIVDNSPTSYLFHPENAVPIGSWFDDRSDTELLDLIPFLEALTKVDDVCSILDPSNT